MEGETDKTDVATTNWETVGDTIEKDGNPLLLVAPNSGLTHERSGQSQTLPTRIGSGSVNYYYYYFNLRMIVGSDEEQPDPENPPLHSGILRRV